MPLAAQLPLAILVFCALGLALVQRSQNRVRQLRDVGMYPQQGEEADADVDRLLQRRPPFRMAWQPARCRLDQTPRARVSGPAGPTH